VKKTLLLAALTVLAYFVFSVFLIYIPMQTLVDYGFMFSNPIGLVTYPFMHVSPGHLIGNVLLLIPIGLVAEQKLRWKDYFVIYFLAGAVAAVLFGLMYPDVVLVGASAAISGLIAAAAVVDFKKAIAAVIIFSIFMSIVGPQIAIFTKQQLDELEKQNNQLSLKITDVDQQITVAVKKNDTEAVKRLLTEKNETVKKMNESIIRSTNLQEGMQREKGVVTSPLVHLAGTLVGFAYIFAFRRDVLWEMSSQLISRKYWLES
jgi:hypothetical protein